MKLLTLSPAVEDEIEAAIEFYESQSRGLGATFLTAIEAAFDELVAAPSSHARVFGTTAEENFRRVLVRRFPYHVVFREREEDLLVLACMHARREPNYWREKDT